MVGGMTDKQLAILLDGIAESFGRAIQDAESQLDSALERPRSRRHRPIYDMSSAQSFDPPLGPGCFGGMCKHDSHYEEVIDPSPITAPLWEALERLHGHINDLNPPILDK